MERMSNQALGSYMRVKRRRLNVAENVSERRNTASSCSLLCCDGVAYCSIGLRESALKGLSRPFWTSSMTGMINELLTKFPFLIGICFCESGECGKGISAKGRRVFEQAVREGFFKSGAGRPVFYYTKPKDHCVAAFRSHVRVVNRNRVSLCEFQTHRYAQRLEIVYDGGATEHIVRIYNCHQPSSKKRPLTNRARLEGPRVIAQDAANDGVDGFVCGGNMKVGKAGLAISLRDQFGWKKQLVKVARYVCSTKKAARDSSVQKHCGDIAFSCNVDLIQVDCDVTNIQPANDIVVAGWERPVRSESRWNDGPEQGKRDEQAMEDEEEDAEEADEEEGENEEEDKKIEEEDYNTDGLQSVWDGCTFLSWMSEFLPRITVEDALDIPQWESLVVLDAVFKQQFRIFADAMLCGTQRTDHDALPAGHVSRASCFAEPKSVCEKMESIMNRRRRIQPDDRQKCSVQQRRKLFNEWRDEFVSNPWNLEEYGLTEKQKRRMSQSQQSSAFRAYLKNNFGGKHWIMAIWHEGLSWVPEHLVPKPPHASCTLEHKQELVDAFCVWLARVVHSFSIFQHEERTVRAREKSGLVRGQSGLTEQQKEVRGPVIAKPFGMTVDR